ncbi:uncharacterized protein LOC133887409 [Phragmites australis]|uniref:uncharacterized protein LOC133887409 n=1 Tax=Phragmites australis TaxID=29695 RepID=UPI002D79067A|nr:uncharacterized protein LOC133887409 [Phragmites australis]
MNSATTTSYEESIGSCRPPTPPTPPAPPPPAAGHRGAPMRRQLDFGGGGDLDDGGGGGDLDDGGGGGDLDDDGGGGDLDDDSLLCRALDDIERGYSEAKRRAPPCICRRGGVCAVERDEQRGRWMYVCPSRPKCKHVALYEEVDLNLKLKPALSIHPKASNSCVLNGSNNHMVDARAAINVSLRGVGATTSVYVSPQGAHATTPVNIGPRGAGATTLVYVSPHGAHATTPVNIGPRSASATTRVYVHPQGTCAATPVNVGPRGATATTRVYVSPQGAHATTPVNIGLRSASATTRVYVHPQGARAATPVNVGPRGATATTRVYVSPQGAHATTPVNIGPRSASATTQVYVHPQGARAATPVNVGPRGATATTRVYVNPQGAHATTPVNVGSQGAGATSPDNVSPQGARSNEPLICLCTAGKCTKSIEKGKQYYVCPIPKGQGACSHKVLVNAVAKEPPQTGNNNTRGINDGNNLQLGDKNANGSVNPAQPGDDEWPFVIVDNDIVPTAQPAACDEVRQESPSMLHQSIAMVKTPEKSPMPPNGTHCPFTPGSDICFQCHEKGHWSKDCPKSSPGSSPCYWCGMVRHWKADCPPLRDRREL